MSYIQARFLKILLSFKKGTLNTYNALYGEKLEKTFLWLNKAEQLFEAILSGFPSCLRRMHEDFLFLSMLLCPAAPNIFLVLLVIFGQLISEPSQSTLQKLDYFE